jgi:Glycosyltransferase family 28 C-terminal domain
VIGYYVHHVGTGHLNRARAVAAVAGAPVVGLSSLPRPEDWVGDWLVLDRDDGSPSPTAVTAHGQLHWVPRGDSGLRRRMSQLSAWLERARPDVLVSDVSVEVALLARLHGVPVVSYLMPGKRTDPAHLLGHGISDALIACWPEDVHGMAPGLPAELRSRVTCVGALSRLPVADPRPRTTGGPRVTVLLGTGGGQPASRLLERCREETPEWQWTVLGRGHRWTDDVAAVLSGSDVVVTQAGENAIAEVAACRRPAVVIPAERPHEEQVTTAQVLAEGGWPVLVEQVFPPSGWPFRLGAARELDAARWSAWCDGKAAHRIADLLHAVAR